MEGRFSVASGRRTDPSDWLPVTLTAAEKACKFVPWELTSTAWRMARLALAYRFARSLRCLRCNVSYAVADGCGSELVSGAGAAKLPLIAQLHFRDSLLHCSFRVVIRGKNVRKTSMGWHIWTGLYYLVKCCFIFILCYHLCWMKILI